MEYAIGSFIVGCFMFYFWFGVICGSAGVILGVGESLNDEKLINKIKTKIALPITWLVGLVIVISAVAMVANTIVQIMK